MTNETQTAQNYNGGGTKTTIDLDEAFAYQHGRLTYHELTVKDRFPDIPVKEGELTLVETLQTGTFTREYKVYGIYPKEHKTVFPQKYQWVVQQHNSNPSTLETEMAPDTPGSVFSLCDGNIVDPSPTGVYNPMTFGNALVTRIDDEMTGRNILKPKTIRPKKDGNGFEKVDLAGVAYHKVAYAVSRELTPIIHDYARLRGLPLPNTGFPIGGGYRILGSAEARPLTPSFNGIWLSANLQQRLHTFPPLFMKQDYIDLIGIYGWVLSGNSQNFLSPITDESVLRLLCYDRDYGIMAQAKMISQKDKRAKLESIIPHLRGFIAAASELKDGETADKANRILQGIEKTLKE
jgi:hypothetical protein